MQEQYKVEILPTAWEDLKSIEDYYLLQFGVESAMKVTDQILNSIERLELYPNFGDYEEKSVNMIFYDKNER